MLRWDLPLFFCVWLAMRCEWVGRRMGKQKHNRLNAVMFLRVSAQGRQHGIDNLEKRQGVAFNTFFSSAVVFCHVAGALGQRLFNIMANYMECRKKYFQFSMLFLRHFI